MSTLKKLSMVMLLFTFVTAGVLSSCREEKKEEKTEAAAEHPEGEEHPTDDAAKGEHPEGEEHPEDGEHPEGEEHPAKDSVSG